MVGLLYGQVSAYFNALLYATITIVNMNSHVCSITLKDSFLASWIKQKLNSAWVLTVTVAAPHGKRSELYTFVIAIGPSKASHHSVVAHALREIRKLQTPKLRYCGKTNTFIWTAFKLIVYLSDRPERSHLTFTGLLGTFSRDSSGLHMWMRRHYLHVRHAL